MSYDYRDQLAQAVERAQRAFQRRPNARNAAILRSMLADLRAHDYAPQDREIEELRKGLADLEVRLRAAENFIALRRQPSQPSGRIA